ncbi:hypothetical protein [Janthinobacterium sp. LB3P112]|uniref:hypothetical protein n=1 Tax=Janthinobacterium sp. LB3P112 TaxID=3424196 RepID=UPI003F21D70B
MSEIKSKLKKDTVLRLLVKHGADFEVEKPAVFANQYAFSPKPRTHMSSGSSLRKQMNSGDFKVSEPCAGRAMGDGRCRWSIVLKVRSLARTLALAPRTDLFYELTGPTPEALQELLSDEQVKIVAEARKLPPKKAIKDRTDML